MRQQKIKYEVLIATFIILLIMKLVWSVVISKSFIISIELEEDFSNNPSELIDKLTNLTFL